MEFTDTHCHIQFTDYPLDTEEVIENARAKGVTRLLAVGCALPDSQAAIWLAAKHDNVWASIGLHPHEAARYVHDHHALQQFRNLLEDPQLTSLGAPSGHAKKQTAAARKIVAIGETGLDYYYENSPKEDQKKLLRFQLELAAEHDLPLILHIRDAFSDFWPVFDDYKSAGQQIRGVVHSFTSDVQDLEQILSRGLYVGLNGIMTFTKDKKQLEAAKQVPPDRLVLETDAPFLTPHPFRGKICEPWHVSVTAEFLANMRGESLEELAKSTTSNARKLFKI